MNLALFAFLFLWNIKDTEAISKNTIETIPPTPYNQLATGYSGLVARAIFKKTDSTTNCGWRYNGDTLPPQGESTGGELQFHIVGIGCVNRTNPSNETITCVEREIKGTTHIITSLTYLQPLSSDLVLAVRCNNGADLIIELPNKSVRECNQQLTANVVVNGNSRKYDAQGTFGCNNNGKLFYANGSEPSSNQATCRYTAEWSGQDNLQCWTAPNCSIPEDLKVIEGNDVTLHCQCNDSIPSGNTSIFYFNNSATAKAKGNNLTISSLQASDNNNQVSCQAVTPYTKLYNESGRSPNYTINVLYAPFRENQEPCKWIFNQSSSCVVTFMSNPLAECVSLKKGSNVIRKSDQCNVSREEENLQTFRYETTLATDKDNGEYNLTLSSPEIPPYNHTLTFTIVVTPESPYPEKDDTALIAGLCASCMVLVALIVFLFVYFRKRNSKIGKMKGSEVNEENGNSLLYGKATSTYNVEEAHPTVDKKKKTKSFQDSTVKEEKANPLYAPAVESSNVEETYAEVDRKKKTKRTKVKEEKVNPLYVSSDQPDGVEPAYGVVEKNKKKKKPKGENVS